jgi:methyltransferase (TIGR00027 family)
MTKIISDARIFAAPMPNPISRTAYYPLVVRAMDAASQRPIGRDTYAHVFMNEDAQRIWEEFKSFKAPNGSNAARHVMIDDHLQRGLNTDPAAPVVIIGAGFDTRAFRLKGGRWFEFDEPEILTYKESRLPAATAPNLLQRIEVNFAKGELAGKLAVVPAAAHTHVIIEGVFMYLTISQRRELLDTLAARFPHHTLYCDLMSKAFFETYSRKLHLKIAGMGATFVDMVEHPERAFIDAGYKMRSLESVPLYSAEHGDIGVPTFMVKWVMRGLRDGYVLGVFER